MSKDIDPARFNARLVSIQNEIEEFIMAVESTLERFGVMKADEGTFSDYSSTATPRKTSQWRSRELKSDRTSDVQSISTPCFSRKEEILKEIKKEIPIPNEFEGDSDECPSNRDHSSTDSISSRSTPFEKLQRCIICHKLTARHVKTMCVSCYSRERYQIKKKNLKRCGECGEKRYIAALGLCSRCYNQHRSFLKYTRMISPRDSAAASSRPNRLRAQRLSEEDPIWLSPGRENDYLQYQ